MRIRTASYQRSAPQPEIGCSGSTEAIRTADPAAVITLGLHMEDLEEDRLLGPLEAAAACDFLTMHGYPVYARWAEGPTDEHVLPFLAQLTSWLAGGAEVLFSEFGAPTYRETDLPSEADRQVATVVRIEEQAAAAYTERALAVLHRAGCLGAMVWCYADYAESTWSEPPLDVAVHERSFGLWRSDGLSQALGGGRGGLRPSGQGRWAARSCLAGPGT